MFAFWKEYHIQRLTFLCIKVYLGWYNHSIYTRVQQERGTHYIIILLRYILLGWFLPTKWIFDCSTPVLLFLSTLDNPWLMCNTSARCCRREWVPIIGLMNIWSNARMQAHILQRNLIEKSILFNPFVHT